MEVYYDAKDIPYFFNYAVVTTGAFDGVHKGHQKLIEHIKSHVKSIGGESVIITFNPHPRFVLNPENTSLRLLTTLDEKIKLLELAGIDHLIVMPFTKEFSQLTAHDYVAGFLVEKFHPHTIVLGYNHNFGHHRDGNIELLKKMSTEYGYEVLEIGKQIVDEIDVSSTRIRAALDEGDMQLATHLLGRPYSFEGIVVKGKQLGRQIGFPTANISVNDPHKLIPAFGVYAVNVYRGDSRFKGAMSVGINPTVGGAMRSIEVNIFDFDKDIYGETLKVECIHYLRPEQKFDGLESLKTQIAIDVEKAVKLLE